MLKLHSCSSKSKKRQSAVTKIVAMNSSKNIVLYFDSFSASLCLIKKQEVSVIFTYMCYVILIDVKVNHLPVCIIKHKFGPASETKLLITDA